MKSVAVGREQSTTIGIRVIAALVACAATFAIAGEVTAEELPTTHSSPNGPTGQADAPGARPVVITVSRAADALGKPVYAARSSLAGTGSLVVFSTSRPRVFSTPAALSISPTLMAPTGSALPVAARALTSTFGMRGHPLLGRQRAHLGIDLAAPTGSPIVATSDGVVTTADWRGGYGLLVALDHGRGLETRYGHMSRLGVLPGQRVSRGQILGFVGSTGLSTGPHLHYEMRVNGRPVDPLPSFARKR